MSKRSCAPARRGWIEGSSQRHFSARCRNPPRKHRTCRPGRRDFSNSLEPFSCVPLAVLVALGGGSWSAAVAARGRLVGWGLAIAALLMLAGAGAIVGFLRPLGAMAFLVSSLWFVVVAITLGLLGSPLP